MKIFIASDHAGYVLKEYIKKWFNTIYRYSLPSHIDGVYYIDIGPSNGERCDYPDYAHKIAKLVSLNEDSVGIVICGTGIGMSIVCNRYENIRCANCHDVLTASLARKHNNSNILALGARINSNHSCVDIIETFLNTKFEGGRHIARLDKINDVSK